MVAKYGDEYWAQWARDFCEVAAVWPHRPGVAYGEMIGWNRQRVATALARLRSRGLITPIEDGIHLTPAAEEILNNLDVPAESMVAFNIRVLARNKGQALARIWDLEQQLENWDPSSGQPFRPRESG